MTFNVELGKKVLEFITTHPERHNQNDWFEESSSECGTTACVAGWTCIIGLDLPLEEEEGEPCDCGCEGPGGITYYYYPPVGRWDGAGQELLGISDEMAVALFTRTNDETALAALAALTEGVSEEEVMETIRAAFKGCPCGCDSF